MDEAEKEAHAAAMMALVPPKWKERILVVHKILDDDGGGTIEYAELAEVDKSGAIYRRLNATGDGDGEIDPDEFVTFFGEMLSDERGGRGAASRILSMLETHAFEKRRKDELAKKAAAEAAKKALAERNKQKILGSRQRARFNRDTFNFSTGGYASITTSSTAISSSSRSLHATTTTSTQDGDLEVGPGPFMQRQLNYLVFGPKRQRPQSARVRLEKPQSRQRPQSAKVRTEVPSQSFSCEQPFVYLERRSPKKRPQSARERRSSERAVYPSNYPKSVVHIPVRGNLAGMMVR